MDLKENMRQLARLEYRAKSSAKTATVNIQQVFGFHAVDLAKVKEWFGGFYSENVKKFKNDDERDSAFDTIFPDGTDKFFDPMICQIKNGELYETMVTFEGRVGYAAVRKKLYVVDLFHGDTKELLLPFDTRDCSPLEFVDHEHFLIFEPRSSRLHLFKFGLEEFTLTELHSVHINGRLRGGRLLADQLEFGKFGLRDSTFNGHEIQLASVVDDRIVLGEIVREEGFSNVSSYAILNGSVISAFSRNDNTSCRFHKFDLNTGRLKTYEIPNRFSNGDMFNAPGYAFRCTLSASRAYVAYKTRRNPWKVAVLNTGTREWFSTGIEVLGHIYSIHVDHNEMLTVITGGLGATTTVYRFPLKKPDTLVNLAWFAYTRRFKATGRRGYNSLFNRLPYTCDLCPVLPMGKKARVSFK